MSFTLTYPGVYVTELPSGVHPITGVSTSTAAFVGMASRGPVNVPQILTSWGDFQRIFGGLASGSTMSYAVYQFFQAGGSLAIAVRLTGANAGTATVDLGDNVKLDAASAGAWGDNLAARVDYNTSNPADATLWNLTVRDLGTGTTEKYLNISTDATSVNSLSMSLARSAIVTPDAGASLTTRPGASAKPPAGTDPWSSDTFYTAATADSGKDGDVVAANDIIGSATAPHTGINALLDTTVIFNILCIPSPDPTKDLDPSAVTAAAALCLARRAMLIVDPPVGWTSVSEALAGMSDPPVSGDAAANAALYFPRFIAQDPVTGQSKTYSVTGAIAGIWAATDTQLGVWKAPAGINAGISATSLAVTMTDAENGELNPLGLNCLRTFPVIGNVVWGARTLKGADVFANQWKYIPVRRLALYIEESLRQGTQWVVFEPNAEPLWSNIRLNVTAFMQDLYRRGAFAGATPDLAYLVKCDAENNPPDQVDLGIVNILVGFQPLEPAEFVLISIEQLAGQA